VVDCLDCILGVGTADVLCASLYIRDRCAKTFCRGVSGLSSWLAGARLCVRERRGVPSDTVEGVSRARAWYLLADPRWCMAAVPIVGVECRHCSDPPAVAGGSPALSGGGIQLFGAVRPRSAARRICDSGRCGRRGGGPCRSSRRLPFLQRLPLVVSRGAALELGRGSCRVGGGAW